MDGQHQNIIPLTNPTRLDHMAFHANVGHLKCHPVWVRHWETYHDKEGLFPGWCFSFQTENPAFEKLHSAILYCAIIMVQWCPNSNWVYVMGRKDWILLLKAGVTQLTFEGIKKPGIHLYKDLECYYLCQVWGKHLSLNLAKKENYPFYWLNLPFSEVCLFNSWNLIKITLRFIASR